MKNIFTAFRILILFLTFCVNAQETVLDNTFGTEGKISFSFNTNQFVKGMATLPDGKILATGNYYFNSPYDKFYIQRLMPNGTPDASFAPGSIFPGAVFFNYGFKSIASDIVIMPDGKIVVCGYTSDQGGNSGNMDFLIVRFNADGAVDTTFGNQGVYTVPTVGAQKAAGMVVQGDKLLVSGELNLGKMMRLNFNGTLDTTFGTNGYIPNGGKRIIIGPDGGIYIAAKSFAGTGVRKYTSNGIPDSSFGTAGVALVNIVSLEDFLDDLYLAQDGKIFIIGSRNSQAGYYGYTIGFDAQGNVLQGFGTNGVLTKIASVGQCFGKSVMVQNNKLVVAYSTGISTNYDYTVAVYNMDGTPFTNFGNNGEYTFFFGAQNMHDYLNATFIQPDGKWLLGGRSAIGATIARMNPVNVTSAGIEDFEQDDIIAYPNPAIEQLTLKMKGNTDIMHIKLYNMFGVEVYNGTLTNGNANINVSHMASGTYLVKAEVLGKTFSQKIMIK